MNLLIVTVFLTRFTKMSVILKATVLMLVVDSIERYNINLVHFTTCQIIQVHNLEEASICGLINFSNFVLVSVLVDIYKYRIYICEMLVIDILCIIKYSCFSINFI